MDLDKFINASLLPRTKSVDVPELTAFFGKKPAVWTVRSLTASELARANIAAEKGAENIAALVEAVAGNGDKAEAIRKSLGISESDVPGDISRRIELLTTGSVDPELGSDKRDVAVKMAESFPTAFYALTNAILSLTGEGAALGKPKRSGKTLSSKTP